MAVSFWIGAAEAVAQVDTATPANVEVDDIFTLTCGGESVSFTATAATVANVTAGITAAWNASTVSQHAEITATDSTTHITLTGDTAGVPFTITASETDGGGTDDQTFTMATTTAATGPNYINQALNWSDGSVPGVGDIGVCDGGSSVDILYGLSSFSAATFIVKKSYTGEIGLPDVNASGYAEYRDTYLDLSDTATIEIGDGDGSGSGRIKIDLDDGTSNDLIIFGSGTPSETDRQSIIIKGGNSGTPPTLTIYDGYVEVANVEGDVADFGAISILPNETSRCTVVFGDDVDYTSYLQSGGDVSIRDASSTMVVNGGTLTTYAGTITSLTIRAATVYVIDTLTVTTLYLGQSGTIDSSKAASGLTLTNSNLYAGAVVYDPHGLITWSNDMTLVQCRVSDVVLDVGANKSIGVS